ncbi:MAG: cell division protein FtsZ [Clostridiales bacterium]|nr:cell division protein FtsZ [Clostridiales bacterium]
MIIDFDSSSPTPVNIKVLGVGGGGNNAVNRMITSGITSVEFIAVNTDKQDLNASRATQKIQIGEKLTKGQGAGSIPEKGARAAEENRDELAAALKGADMVFITAGMGGGTGTGASPIIAALAKEMGILTVGIVTKPFLFEGKSRMSKAEDGIRMLREQVDSLIIIPNERLKLVSDTPITLANAFEKADDVLRLGVANLSDLINIPGYINLDFADVSSVMKDAGYAHMGVGHGTGRDRMTEAVLEAINSPLIETTINGARGVIINIFSPPDIGLTEVDDAVSMVTAAVHPDANIIFGVSFDEDLSDEARVTIIATGFETLATAEPREVPQPAQAHSSGSAMAGAVLQQGSTTTVKPFSTPFAPAATTPVGAPVAAGMAAADSEDKARRLISDDDINDIDSILNIFKKRG